MKNTFRYLVAISLIAFVGDAIAIAKIITAHSSSERWRALAAGVALYVIAELSRRMWKEGVDRGNEPMRSIMHLDGREENTLYIRQRPDGQWECLGKAKGDAFRYTAPTKEGIIKYGRRGLWALNKYGPKKYEAAIARMDDEDYPDELGFPVVEESPRN